VPRHFNRSFKNSLGY